MKKWFYQLKHLLLLFRSTQKQKNQVFQDLKDLHQAAGWSSGIFEKDYLIQTSFQLSGEDYGDFYYLVTDQAFVCRIPIIRGYEQTSSSEAFILATHFNNLLKDGLVRVYPEPGIVEYETKTSLAEILLHPEELYFFMLQHHSISKDLFWAFSRLFEEEEEPAMIIADLMLQKETENKSDQ